MVFRSNWIWRLLSGSALACSMALPGGVALANTSLPLDIDLTSTDSEQDVTEPAPDAEGDAVAPQPAPVVPLEPPPPLRPTTNVRDIVKSGVRQKIKRRPAAGLSFGAPARLVIHL